MKLTLQEIANLIDGSIEGDNTKEIYGLNSLVNAEELFFLNILLHL